MQKKYKKKSYTILGRGKPAATIGPLEKSTGERTNVTIVT